MSNNNPIHTETDNPSYKRQKMSTLKTTASLPQTYQTPHISPCPTTTDTTTTSSSSPAAITTTITTETTPTTATVTTDNVIVHNALPVMDITPERPLSELSPTSFPVKLMDRMTPGCNRPTTPSARRNFNPLFLRRISMAGTTTPGASSEEDSPSKTSILTVNTSFSLNSQKQQQKNHTEYQRNHRRSIGVRHHSPDSDRHITFLIGTPRVSHAEKEEIISVCPKTVLMEVNRDMDNDQTVRPPSPRPEGDLQNCVEYNKQMQVWDDWVALANSESDCPVASISFKRIESKSNDSIKPKALKILSEDGSDAEENGQ